MLEPAYLSLVFAYMLGAIPFGLVLSKMAGKGDVRKIGSGNIGATNVLRTGNKWLALATLLLDIGKGTAAVLITAKFDPALAGPAALAAFVGHVFPIFLMFKGGKGVATFVGVLLALQWQVGLIVMGVWIGMAAIFRISSLASLSAAIVGPTAVYFLLGQTPALWVLGMTLIILYAHRENIKRLFKGEEPKIGNSQK